MNRKREQAELLFRTGQFFGPLIRVAENPNSYDVDERTRIAARFFSEEERFREDFRQFAEGEPGHRYSVQYTMVVNLMVNLKSRSVSRAGMDDNFWRDVKEAASNVLEAVYAIPVPIDSTIYEQRTPFSTYCFVKDLCMTARKEIVWLDRYFDQGLFHRYFVATPVMMVTLVTWPASKSTSAKDKQRYSEFADMSKLFAAERGPQGYRLIVNDDFHDRWLRCDDKLFALGGSIKDITKATTFTISRVDPTQENLQRVNEAITSGTEVFGPNRPTHL